MIDTSDELKGKLRTACYFQVGRQTDDSIWYNVRENIFWLVNIQTEEQVETLICQAVEEMVV
jgi:hypothetical protein